MYVNGSYRGDDSIGKLMHDFCAVNADEMYYGELAEKVRFHKQETKGAQTMCRIFEEYGNERAAEGRAESKIELVENLLRDGTLPIEKIAKLSDVPLEQVKSIAEKISESMPS